MQNSTKPNIIFDELLININNSTFTELKTYYDTILNNDKSSFKTSNDEPTPISCISEMISHIPENLWNKPDLKILDPCSGNGNFSIPILFKLLEYYDKKTILEKILHFNDTNEDRLNNVRIIFCDDIYDLQITSNNFIEENNKKEVLYKYDLIMANPPYANYWKMEKEHQKIIT